MNPLAISKTDFAAMIEKPVSITYDGEQVIGRIKQVYLAANPPHEVGSFDFELSPQDEIIFKKAGIPVPTNFSILDITDVTFLK